MKMSGATEPPVQSRRTARRRLLLDATVRVIGRGGIAAVDHRAVAAEAGVPLGSTTYYFESKADLIASALEHAADREAARLWARIEDGTFDVAPSAIPARLAEVIVEVWSSDRVTHLVQCELYLQSARRADARPAAERWGRAYRDLLAYALAQAGVPGPDRRARLIGGCIFGLLIRHLATVGDPGEQPALVAELIERLATP